MDYVLSYMNILESLLPSSIGNGNGRDPFLFLALSAILFTLGCLFICMYDTIESEMYSKERGGWIISSRDYPEPPPGLDWHLVPPGSAPVVNPLKGFMPYATDENLEVFFPYTMEYFYVPVKSVVDCEGLTYRFNFEYLEKLLDDIAKRGRQAVFRLYFDYPGLETAVPQCIIDAGVRMHRYTEYGGGLSPDYDDPRMVELMVRLIEELGAKFDGDPRIAFIQAGLLGHWGEWHTYPNTHLFASEATQLRVLEAYDRSFNKTRILVRYPNKITRRYNVGFHDDSFAFQTLGDEAWYFYNLLESSGTLDRWKVEPIGGEVRPEIQADVFREEGLFKHLIECIETTHVSFLLCETLFRPRSAKPSLTSKDLRRAIFASQRMGYTFAVCYAAAEKLPNDAVKVSVVVKNFGVAPFYYGWTVDFGIVTAEGTSVAVEKTKWTLAGILPNQTVMWSHVFYNVSRFCKNNYYFAIRVSNPLPRGRPVLFANKDQLPNGWLLLLECSRS